MGSNVPIRTTAIQWVNGVPEPIVKHITPTSVKTLATTALSMPYQGEYNEELDMYIVEPRFAGMTNAEVMWIRTAEKAASGDLAATNLILDRVLGKPKQSVESMSMSMSYPEFLEFLAKKEDNKNGGIEPNGY